MPTSDDTSNAQDVLDFWFGAGTAELNQPRAVWWTRDASFDAEIASRFASLHAKARRGELSHWTQDADASLALVILLDQFSRNLHRGTPDAFVNDAAARAIAGLAIDRGFDRAMLPVRAQFFYLPFMHSEALVDQERCLALFAALPTLPQHENSMQFARRHLEIIARFGRFPHRNETLGRTSTAEEIAFLEEPHSSF